MSYENAASTKMLASHCAFCARPLRDAQSVESGVGPICRRRYMVADRVDEQARKEGNKLIHTIAKHQNGPGVEKALERLSELGFTNVVKRIRKRIKKHSVQKVELFYRSGVGGWIRRRARSCLMSHIYLFAGAEISECKRYRYRLWRCWDNDKPTCLFVMLNPSTADGENDDPTIRRCVSFAKREGCGMLMVVNLFAYRTAYPKELLESRDRGSDIIGPQNETFIYHEAMASRLVIAAWGAQPYLRGRDKSVEALIRQARDDRKIHCLGTTKSGAPRHPVRLAKDTPLQEWRSS